MVIDSFSPREPVGRMHGCSAFTLIELLVVIMVIAIMIALILPSVISARESARRVGCQNNLKQIGLALASYESSFNILPPAYESRIEDFVLELGNGWAWSASILSYLDQVPLYSSINFSQSSAGASSRTIRRTRLTAFLCPSSQSRDVTLVSWETSEVLMHDIAPSNYIASAGSRSKYVSPVSRFEGRFTRNSLEDGLMYRNSAIKLSSVSDGLSHTFLVGERSSFHAPAIWYATLSGASCAVCTSPDHNRQECVGTNITVLGHSGPYFQNGIFSWTDRPNNVNAGADGYSSMHYQGSYFLFADGTVRFLKNSIDAKIYNALGTRQSGEVLNESQF